MVELLYPPVVRGKSQVKKVKLTDLHGHGHQSCSVWLPPVNHLFYFIKLYFLTKNVKHEQNAELHLHAIKRK